MRKLYFGGAIQGAKNRQERAHINIKLIETIREEGFEVVCEHTTGKSKEETAQLLEQSIGPLPPKGLDRTTYVRNKMIEFVEGDICAAIFEVSIPSLGTGIEIAHSYLRQRMGLPEIPILALYEKGYWPNNVSSMIKGISIKEVQQFQLVEYDGLEYAIGSVREFLKKLKQKD